MNFQQKQQQQQQPRQQWLYEKIAGLILQNFSTSLTQNFQMQSITSFQHLTSQYIDQVMEIEMQRVKANCSREEANYVEQMLLENPITVERRTTSPTLETKATPPASSITTTKNHIGATDYCYSNMQVVLSHDEASSLLHQHHQQQLQQRSDSCRRSRINNKVKKAKMKYRHQFMSNKLLQSANMLDCLRQLIEQTENQLINRGLNALQLLELKKIFCSSLTETEL